MRPQPKPIVNAVEWQILRGQAVVGTVACPDETTALLLGAFRYGSGITVKPIGA